MSARPFETWDEALSEGLITDEPDGFPDRLMVPLVQQLRREGYVTYQSCAGHEGHSDGTLWIEQAPAEWMALNTGEFERVQHVVVGPEGNYWEFWWEPDKAKEAIRRLALLYHVSDGGEDRP